MLNPTWLTTFKTLIEIGHFTKTAERLFMTQPGVSQHIKKLEQQCGYPLIKRFNKQFELTEQGRLVYQYALSLEQQEQQLISSLAFDNPVAGECRLSCSGSMALQLYPLLLGLQQKHQELRFHIEVAPTKNILTAIQAGDIDLGIITEQPDEKIFEATQIGSERLCLVLPKAHAKYQDLHQTMMTLGLISHPDANHYLSVFLEQCQEPSLASLNPSHLPSSGYINQLQHILMPVARGVGFTVLPYTAISNSDYLEQLHIVDTKQQATEPLFLIKAKHRELAARYQKIIELINAIG